MEFQSLKPKNIFPYRQISRASIFIGLFIIISASFMRQLMDFIQVYIGKEKVIILLGLTMIIVCLMFLIFTMKKKIHAIKTPALILVLITGLILAWQIKIPVEKVHILEYGVLGWFIARDLIKVKRKNTGIILACIFCIVVGVLDELFQAVLPYRVFDLRDIVFNGLGGAWGIILYLLA